MSEPEPTPPEPTPPPEPSPPAAPEPGKWMEALGFNADLRANPTLNKYISAEAQARAHIELQRTLGAERIALPGKDAKPEELDAIFGRLGRPETVEGYELNGWEPPEGVPWNADVTTKMLDRMHAHRLTKDQAQGVLNDYAKVYADLWDEHLSNVDTVNEQTLGELHSKWGAACEAKWDAVKRAAVHFAGPSGENGNLFDQILLEDGRCLGDHPAIIEILAEIGEHMGEDGALGEMVCRTTQTPDEAKRELAEILRDPNKMKILTDVSHPEHKALQERKSDLEKQVYNV